MKIENSGIIGLLVGAAGLIWAGYVSVKCNRVADKLDTTLDDIQRSNNIEIKDSVVKQAVQNAVNTAAKEAVEKATKAAVSSISAKIDREVNDTISEAYSDVRDDVKTRLESQIGSVNIDKVKREIVSEGRDKAARVFNDALNDIRDDAKSKFEGELNDILNRHNNELNSVNRIYSSIAESFGGRGTTLKIG